MKRVTATGATNTLTRFVVCLALGGFLRDRRGRIRTFSDVVSAQAHCGRGDSVKLRASAGV